MRAWRPGNNDVSVGVCGAGKVAVDRDRRAGYGRIGSQDVVVRRFRRAGRKGNHKNEGRYAANDSGSDRRVHGCESPAQLLISTSTVSPATTSLRPLTVSSSMSESSGRTSMT